ncbi:treslin-like [Ylistrum balloti]|uniref:treslin-like n=1 Tax=Ylistrum balloti TaxID=509963 RepID=UPI002905B120|nr:treslin-like [Ylistrum balloti]
MYKNKRTDIQQNAGVQASVDGNTREVDFGGYNILSLEEDVVRKPLLAKGGIKSLRVCAVFLTQTWLQQKWMGQEECVCTATGRNRTRSVMFEGLLTKLHKEKSCLILEVKGHASLVILKPLTTVSASLSLLSVGHTLALEKSLYQDRRGILDIELESLQKKKGPSWSELVTRLTEKQQVTKSRREANQVEACFDPTVIGKAYLPGCHQSFGRLLDKLNQRISQMDFLSQDEKKTLGELQRLYRYENQPPHTRSHCQRGLPSQELTKDKPSIAQEEGKKGQGSLASRGEMMVTRSRQAVNQKGKDEKDSTSGDSRSKDKPTSDQLLSKADFADEEELMTYLQDVYTSALNSSSPSLSVCSQTIITVALHYLKERQTSNPQDRCIKMLDQTIILPLTGLREKYISSSTDVEKQLKIREYQLQILLRLECESMLAAVDVSEVSETDDRVEQVVTLLRTLGFVTDPTALSEFMSGTMVDLYVHTLPHILGRIYDELMQPLPSVLEAILSPNHSADQSVFSHSLLKSDNPGSNQSSLNDSNLSQPPSNQSDVLLNRPKRNARRHTLVHHPSLAEVGPKRQIMVRKVEKKKDKSHKKSQHSKKKTKDQGSGEKVCRNLFENKKTKLERRQSVAVMENIRSRHHHNKRLPNLKSPKALKSPFKSPTFHNKKVSETPAHKQKCQAVFSRIEKERHRSRSVTSIQVVEESPIKACPEQRDSPSQRKRAMAMLRRSFYSAGPTKRSRNLVKYFQLNDRMAGRPPVNRLNLGASLHDLSAEFKSPDKNSSLIFSQLMGSPTPPKSTPNKTVITPAKYLLESPSMYQGSKSPARFDGTPRKHIVNKRLLESPSMNTRSKSPGFSLGHPKVLFGDGSSFDPVIRDHTFGTLTKTPVKEISLVAESPSQNTRSKSTATPRSSRAKMFLFKSPENKGSSIRSISTNISSSKCLNLSKFESGELLNNKDEENLVSCSTSGVLNLSQLKVNGAISEICIKDPEAQSSPRQEGSSCHTKSPVEKTPSPRKTAGVARTPGSLDKRPRRQKLQNLFQSPKSSKVMQSPPTSSEWQNLRQSPRLSRQTINLSQSPTSAQHQGQSPRSRLGQRRSLCDRLLASPRSLPCNKKLCSVRPSPCKILSQNVDEDASVSGDIDSGVVSVAMKSQEFETMDTDNESIFSELSQGFNNKTSALSEISSPLTRKRSLRFSPDSNQVFSPSKRRRVQLHTLDTNKKLSTLSCLQSRILSGRVDSFGSSSSQTSQGFITETCQSQQSIPSFSQSSIDSNDYFSLSNDEVFLSRKPKVIEETPRSDSPVFGSAKKGKCSLVYNTKSVIPVVDDLSSENLVLRNGTMINSVSPNTIRNRHVCSTSPHVTGSSTSGSPCFTRSDLSKSPYVLRKSQTPSGSALTKLSPSNRKYSPNVSAKSLMHLINSPLVTSPNSEERSPHLNQDSLNVKRKRPHGKSKRSLDLQQ